MQNTEYAIHTEFIELNQLLKLCGLASSGGAGCALVAQGNVRVDGQAELRKRCKIRAGQVVTSGESVITVTRADPALLPSKMPKAAKPPKPLAAARSPFAQRPPNVIKTRSHPAPKPKSKSHEKN